MTQTISRREPRNTADVGAVFQPAPSTLRSTIQVTSALIATSHHPSGHSSNSAFSADARPAVWTARAGRRGWEAGRLRGKITLACALALLVSAGCARLGERIQFAPSAPGAPRPADILAALAENDHAIQSFRAAGSFKLESPDFEAVKVFKDGAIAFRRPADLSVRGRNALGMEIFRLTSVGSEFLIDFPASRDKPYYRVEGEQFASVPFSVSPSDIAREMFLPENWDELKKREVRLLDYDPQTTTAILEIGPRNAPRRRVTVMGPPWVVVKNERIEDGQVVAVTAKDDYRDAGGVRFPASIDAWFPGEKTRLTFDMRKISPNAEIDNSLFDIKARARIVGIYLQ